VNHAGLTDNVSMWGSTDGAYYWERRNGGPVWEQKGQWREQSPSAYAAKFKTPMLITHGEQDFRVPISQAFEIYKLLQRRRVPSRLIVFPDANHWVLKGEDARYHMSEVLGWLQRYL
jgi:dipeptidyl aminopeptidase/acylaminoacyl peptidase